MTNENNQAVVETVSAELLASIFNEAGLGETQKAEEATIEQPDYTPTPEVVNELPPSEAPKVQSDYSKRLKNLVKDGILENFSITYGEEDVFIEDIEDLTEEGYQKIVEGWKEAKKSEVDSKYISIEGLDETTKKLIDIKRNGGDITELIRENVTAIDQLSQLKDNIDNEQVQINIVAHSLQQQGIKPAVVKAQIQALIEEGVLDTEANTILDSHLAVHQQAIEQKRNSEIERVEKEKEDLKTLRKTLSLQYKELGLPDSMQKLLVDNATKLDQDKISNTDRLYFEAIKDPKRFAELNFFLNNPEEFKKHVTSPKVTKAKIDAIMPLFSVNINKVNKPKLQGSSLEDFAEDIIKSNNK